MTRSTSQRVPARPAAGLLLAGLLLSGPLLPGPAGAREDGRVVDFGDYTVRVTALVTSFLPEAVTRRYDIPRAQDVALVQVACLHPTEDGGRETVPAEVSVRATDMVGQIRPVGMRRIEENEGISYIGTLPVTPGGEVDFQVRVQPAGSQRDLSVAYSRTFPLRRPPE